jgi:hypothetical protein
LNLLRAFPLEVIQLFYQHPEVLRADFGLAKLTDAQGPLVASSQASSLKSNRERTGLL